MRDRKHEVRELCCTGLSKVYLRHLCPALPSLLAGQSFDTSGFSAILDRLKGFPGNVLRCWVNPDISVRLMLLDVIQSYLLPAQRSEGEDDDNRASAIFVLFRHLSEPDRLILGQVLSFKNNIRFELQKFLEAREDYSTSNRSDGSAEQCKIILYRLMSLLPPADKKTLIFDKLMAVKDKHVFKQLAKATQASCPSQDLNRARENMMQRLDSKSALGEYLGKVFTVACFGFVSCEETKSLLRFASSCSANGDDYEEEAAIITQLLSLLSKHIPSVTIVHLYFIAHDL